MDLCETNKKIMIDCRLNDSFDRFISWGIFSFTEKEDIISLRNKFNVKSLHLVVTDGYSNHMRETLENMDEETFKLYLKYHLATCERADMLGISHHTLVYSEK